MFEKIVVKRIVVFVSVISLVLCCACQKKETSVDVQVFIASSLSGCMDEIKTNFNKNHPDINIVFNSDSSGTLQTQIEEGYECDIFFSAGQKQMEALELKGLLEKNTREELLQNRLVLISGRGSDTKVSCLLDIKNAKSIALADSSVPVGKYTRQALVSVGLLDETDNPEDYTTDMICKKLGVEEISEQGNVSKVLMAVVEGNCEVGTVYYSDIYGFEDKVDVLEIVDTSISGEIVYPVAQIVNPRATEEQKAAASEFFSYLKRDEAKKVFKKYGFETGW